LLKAREKFECDQKLTETISVENKSSSGLFNLSYLNFLMYKLQYALQKLSNHITESSCEFHISDFFLGDIGKSAPKNIYTINARLIENANLFLEIEEKGEFDTFFPKAATEYASIVEEMWKDPSIQATYKRRAELHRLPDVAKHFLDRVGSISHFSNCIGIVTTGILCKECLRAFKEILW
jgi:hypothetical protein